MADVDPALFTTSCCGQSDTVALNGVRYLQNIVGQVSVQYERSNQFFSTVETLVS